MNPLLKVTCEPKQALLSDLFRLEVQIEGAAPLAMPMPLQLRDGSVANWSLTPVGKARVETLADGRERWSQDYRVSPFVVGDALPLEFKPWEILSAGTTVTLEVPTQTLTVRTQIPEANLSQLRGVTGIEPLPPLPPGNPAALVGTILGTSVGLGLMLLLAWRIQKRRLLRRRLLKLQESQEAWQQLERDWREQRLSPRQLAGALSAWLRDWVETRHKLPVHRFTTAELLARLPASTSSDRDSIRRVLEWADAVRFSNIDPSAEECESMLDECRQITAVLEKEQSPSK